MTHNNILTPSTLRMDDFNQVKLLEYLKPIHDKNKLITQFGVCQYTHGVTAVSVAYFGGVYSPTQNRIYLVPFLQSNQTNWHYICLLYTSPSPRDGLLSRMPSSA